MLRIVAKSDVLRLCWEKLGFHLSSISDMPINRIGSILSIRPVFSLQGGLLD